jgi:hypothetical protein
MSAQKRVLLINPTSEPAIQGLGDALRSAGAEVMELKLDAYDAVLDALNQDWMPVVLKVPLD